MRQDALLWESGVRVTKKKVIKSSRNGVWKRCLRLQIGADMHQSEWSRIVLIGLHPLLGALEALTIPVQLAH